MMAILVYSSIWADEGSPPSRKDPGAVGSSGSLQPESAPGGPASAPLENQHAPVPKHNDKSQTSGKAASSPAPPSPDPFQGPEPRVSGDPPVSQTPQGLPPRTDEPREPAPDADVVQAEPGTADAAAAMDATHPPEPPRILEPLFSRSLTMIQTGHNDANPMWSPDGTLLAFERSVGDKQEIIIARRDGSLVQTIYFESPEEEGAMSFFFPGITEKSSYNAGMSWSTDGRSIAFMSNGGSGNYDLYLLRDLNSKDTIRLTQHPGKDSHPHWSPLAGKLVFVSGRTGKADIFSMDLVTRKTTRLTKGPKMYLYPQWSPDGKQIAMIYGANENHDIYLIQDITRPHQSTRALTMWDHDDLRPVWSPDGTKIAFYSNYNTQGDQKVWSLMVIAADGSDPGEGDGLAAKVVAQQVIPDIEQGPAWMPDSKHIVYIRNDEQAYHPIYMVHIEKKIPVAIQTGTKMNHDVTCAKDGTLAFRAQVEQWDHIYIAQLRSDPPPPKEVP